MPRGIVNQNENENSEYTAVEVEVASEEGEGNRDEGERLLLEDNSRSRPLSSSGSSRYSRMIVQSDRTTQYGSGASEIISEEMFPLAGTTELENEREQLRRESSEMFSKGIKLGLGDFVFYSVLVGRAVMYDLMTVYACYLAIISGLGCTLILLSVYHRALPALPISIILGVVFYFLTRLLMEPFVVGTTTNLLMF